MRTFPWTDEHIETLKTMWNAGKSASQIARHLGGVSRNAVIGKTHRLGLQGRSLTYLSGRVGHLTQEGLERVREATKERQRRRREQREKLRNAIRRSKEQPRMPRSPMPPDRPAPASRMVSFADLGKDDCRWPIGEPGKPGFGFCGCQRVDGMSYCEHHARIAYVPVKRASYAKRAA